MDKLELAKYLLEEVGMPPKQQSTLCCLALLSMAKLTKDTPCHEATNNWIRIHDIIAFIGENYGVFYAENSRETFRKQAMHAFRTAALIEDNGKATNSPNYRYRITNEFLCVIQNMNEDEDMLGEKNPYLAHFVSKHDSLSDIYSSKKKMQKMPVRINNQDFTLVQVSIINYKKLSSKNSLQDLLQTQSVCTLAIQFKKIWLKISRNCLFSDSR